MNAGCLIGQKKAWWKERGICDRFLLGLSELNRGSRYLRQNETAEVRIVTPVIAHVAWGNI